MDFKNIILNYGQDFKYKLVISLLSAVLIVFAFVFSWNLVSENYWENHDSMPTCGDGSFYNTCNLHKPYYCDGETGMLVEKASLCGCPSGMQRQEDRCISPYHADSKNASFGYVLRGERSEINLTLYKGMTDYLSNLSRVIDYEYGETPLRSDFKLRNINDDYQRDFLIPLMVGIQNSAADKNDQVRIAISIVQNIPFGNSNKTSNLPNGESSNYSRYPYEVLYDNMGICGEKSELLAFLLKEMGYGVVFFYNQEENHESLGIKCPARHSLYDTGYCFIETTGPSVITDSKIQFVGGVTLESYPEIILVSNGDSLGLDMYEYEDAKELQKIRNGEFVFFRNSKLKALNEKYGLVEFYQIG